MYIKAEVKKSRAANETAKTIRSRFYKLGLGNWVRRSKEVARSMFLLQSTAIDHSIEGSDNHFLTAKASLQAKANSMLKIQPSILNY